MVEALIRDWETDHGLIEAKTPIGLEITTHVHYRIGGSHESPFLFLMPLPGFFGPLFSPSQAASIWASFGTLDKSGPL